MTHNYHVKSFFERTFEALDDSIKGWLSNSPYIELIDVKFAPGETFSKANGEFTCNILSPSQALVIYKELAP